MLKRLLLWFGAFGLLLSLLGLLGGAGPWGRSDVRDSSRYSEPAAPEFPTSVENQADVFGNIPALTF